MWEETVDYLAAVAKQRDSQPTAATAVLDSQCSAKTMEHTHAHTGGHTCTRLMASVLTYTTCSCRFFSRNLFKICIN